MRTSSLRRVAIYAVVATSVVALAYSGWLIGLIGLTLTTASPGELSEVGNGVVVLVYAVLPLTVVLASVGYVLSTDRRRDLGRLLTAASFSLAVTQLVWLVDLISRGVGPLPFAVLATALVAASAVASLRVTRASSGSRQ